MQLQVVISAIDQVSGVVGRIFGLLNRVGGVVTNVIGGALRVVGGLVSHVTGLLGGLFSSLMRIGSVGGLVGGVGIVAGLSAIGAQAVQTGAQFEMLRAKMQTAYRDDAMGDRMFAWAKAFAAKTPFTVPEVVDAAARLRMYGMDAQRWLPLVGDLAGAMGRKVTDAVEAVSDGTRRELERLKEFGLTTTVLSKYGAKTGPGVKGNTPEDARQMEEAIAAAIADRFGGGMAKQSRQAAGIWSNIQDQIISGLNTLGEPLLVAFKRIAPTLQSTITGVFDGLAPVFAAVAPLLQRVAEFMMLFAQVALTRMPAVVALFERLIAVAMPAASQFGVAFGDVLGGALDWVIGKVDKLVGALEQAAQRPGGLFGAVRDAIGGALQFVGEWFVRIGIWLGSELPGLAANAIGVLRDVALYVVDIAASLSRLLPYAVWQATTALGDLATKVGALMLLMPGLAGRGKDLIAQGGAMRMALPPMPTGDPEWAQTAREQINGRWHGVADAAGNAGRYAGDMMIRAGSRVYGAGSDVLGYNPADPYAQGGAFNQVSGARGGREMIGRVDVNVTASPGLSADVVRQQGVAMTRQNAKLGLVGA